MRRGGRTGLIRRFAAGTALIMALLLGGRAAGSIVKSRGPHLFELAGQWLVETLWAQTNPFWEKEKKQIGREEGWRDPDPSYRKYRSMQTFYKEHEYLAWYGNEETGQQTPEDSFSLAAGQTGEAYGISDAGIQENVIPSTETLAGSVNRPITGRTYVLEQLMDYDFLMKTFYNVHTSTTAGRDLMDAKKLLEKDLSIDMEGEGPQILIYHTHSQEMYADSGPGQNVVAVGSYLTELLEAKGYRVYHDQSVYDLRDGQLDRSKAYNYALEGIEAILEQNPSIQVVLDLHRDGVAETLHLATEVDGKPTAQIMFFNGLSQTPEGPVAYLQNPYREDNLSFSLQMQLGAAAYYPGYARKIYLKGLRYNEHLRPRSALVEVGAQTNTYEEARNAMEPLAELLDMVLQGNKKDSIIQ